VSWDVDLTQVLAIFDIEQGKLLGIGSQI